MPEPNAFAVTQSEPIHHRAAPPAEPSARDLAGPHDSLSMRTGGPIKILQVVGGMRRGGVETWLMHILRGLDRDRFTIDFLVHTHERCPFDDEIESLGSRIFRQPIDNPIHYMRKLRKLARRGRYDVVHSHVHHFSGLVLSAARAAMVPVRLAHSHNDTFALERNASLPRRSYLAFSEWLIQRNATAGVAASAEAARSLFGARWSSDARWSILYCGIALDPFRLPLAGKDLRSELGIPAGHLVVGHVGRFDPQKNHHFFAEVASEIARRHPAVHFLLVGDGPLRPTIQDAFAGKGLASQTTFAGLRGDVPQLMRCAMDLLLFPSHFEGLPLTLLEAQAASLPAVISDAISPETDVLPFCITRLSLSAQPSVWADAVLATASKGRPDRNTSLAALESSPFNAAASSTNLLSLYRKCLTAATAR